MNTILKKETMRKLLWLANDMIPEDVDVSELESLDLVQAKKFAEIMGNVEQLKGGLDDYFKKYPLRVFAEFRKLREENPYATSDLERFPQAARIFRGFQTAATWKEVSDTFKSSTAITASKDQEDDRADLLERMFSQSANQNRLQPGGNMPKSSSAGDDLECVNVIEHFTELIYKAIAKINGFTKVAEKAKTFQAQYKRTLLMFLHYTLQFAAAALGAPVVEEAAKYTTDRMQLENYPMMRSIMENAAPTSASPSGTEST